MDFKEVPYIVHESAEARHERIARRLKITLVISIAMLLATNGLWLLALR